MRQWRRTRVPEACRPVGRSSRFSCCCSTRLCEQLPIVQTLENTLLDLRVALLAAALARSHASCCLHRRGNVVLGLQSACGKADEVGTLLGRVFDAGARTVAIDLLLPEQWSRSESFSRLILDHSTKMVLASYSDPEGRRQRPGIREGAGDRRARARKDRKTLRLRECSADPDGVVRTMPLDYRDQQGKGVVFSCGARRRGVHGTEPCGRAADTRLWIDYSIDWTKFERVSWKDVPDVLPRQPEAVS